MKHTAYFETKVIVWSILFSAFLWIGNGGASLQYSDPTKQLIPASQGLQPAPIIDPNGGGCNPSGCNPSGCNPSKKDKDSKEYDGMSALFRNIGPIKSNQPSADLSGLFGQTPVVVNPAVVNPVVKPNPVSTNHPQTENFNVEKPHSYTYVYVTNDSGGVDIQTYDNGVLSSTKFYSGADVASYAKEVLPTLSKRGIAQELSSGFFLNHSFSREAAALSSKYLRLYDSNFSDPNSFSATFIKQLSLSSFVQGPNIKDLLTHDPAVADLSKPLSFDNDVSIRGVDNALSQVPMGTDTKSLSVVEAQKVLNDDRLRAIMVRDVNSGYFFFGHGMIQELLQKDAYEIKGDKVDLRSGDEPSLAMDSPMEAGAKIDLMRSFQMSPNVETSSFTALKEAIYFTQESDPVADSLTMDNPLAVRSAADAFRVLIKKYPGFSIDDMNVKLLEGHLDLDRADAGYLSPWNWTQPTEPTPITSVLSITG